MFSDTVQQLAGGLVEKFYKILVLWCCSVILLSSCSSTSDSDNGLQVQTPLVPLSCIAVLPTETSVDRDETIRYEEARSLEKGAALATGIVAETLAGRDKVRILSSSQVSDLVSDISGGVSGTVAALGRKINCDSVLLTTVREFTQREGTDYSVDTPASVDFRMLLSQTSTGNVLWAADFRETQESFLENIFSYSKMKSRGFKWITAEQLLEEGIKKRLAECPYLQ